MQTLNRHVALVGAGSMGGAIAAGLAASGLLADGAVSACDLDPANLDRMAQAGVTCFADARDLVAAADDVVILAVKPQVLFGVIDSLADLLADNLVISIAAGVNLASLEDHLPGVRVIRAMPNLPIQVRSGATALTAGSRATQEDMELARTLFSALGVAEIMREDQLDAEGAVVSCGPAFFALMVDTLTRAGIRAGLPAASCRAMVESTMGGVATQLLESGEHPRAYVEKVTSPGGTTAEALKALEPLLVQGSYDAVEAALNRTRELAG